MVESLDDLFFLDFPSASHPPTAAALLLDFLDNSVDALPGFSNGGGNEEEEELEWLSNKDAFPEFDIPFDIPKTTNSPISVLSAPSPKIPVKPRTKGRRRRRSTAMSALSAAAALRAVAAAERRRCRHCGSEETPQWRAGPEGPKTLCNACGVRYKSGRLLPEYRPASSPTFSPVLHSNSHRRVLEMRRRKAFKGARRGLGR